MNSRAPSYGICVYNRDTNGNFSGKSSVSMKERPKTNPAFEAARGMNAPLAAQLEHYAALQKERSPVVADAYQALIDTLIRGSAGENAAMVGDALPPFLLPDENGKLVSSAALLSAGPLVVSFNRGNWCPFCWLELSAYQALHSDVRQHGGEIISITPETATYSRQLKTRLGLTFPVLSDVDNGYALELGLAIALSSEIKTHFRNVGIDLGLYQNNDAWFVPVPATIVLDTQGIIKESYVNADFRRRIDPSGLPDLISAIR